METLILIILAIIVWLICRHYEKREYKADNDKPREDQIVTKEDYQKKHTVKTKIEKLLKDIREEREERIKEREENEPKFEEDNEEVKCIFKGKKFLFDKEGYEFFKDEFILFGELSIINGYLAIDNPANDWIIFFHRKFMRIEIEDFCLKNNCNNIEVVIHHIDFSTTNNKKENLRVMLEYNHKKLHRKIHGF